MVVIPNLWQAPTWPEDADKSVETMEAQARIGARQRARSPGPRVCKIDQIISFDDPQHAHGSPESFAYRHNVPVLDSEPWTHWELYDRWPQWADPPVVAPPTLIGWYPRARVNHIGISQMDDTLRATSDGQIIPDQPIPDSGKLEYNINQAFATILDLPTGDAWLGNTLVQNIPSLLLSQYGSLSGNQVRLTIGFATFDLGTTAKVYMGKAAGAGFATVPAHITFNGGSDLVADGVTTPVNIWHEELGVYVATDMTRGSWVSDWINLPEDFDQSSDYCIAASFVGTGATDVLTFSVGYTPGMTTYLKAGDDAATQNKVGYATYLADTAVLVQRIEIRQGPAPVPPDAPGADPTASTQGMTLVTMMDASQVLIPEPLRGIKTRVTFVARTPFQKAYIGPLTGVPGVANTLSRLRFNGSYIATPDATNTVVSDPLPEAIDGTNGFMVAVWCEGNPNLNFAVDGKVGSIGLATRSPEHGWSTTYIAGDQAALLDKRHFLSAPYASIGVLMIEALYP